MSNFPYYQVMNRGKILCRLSRDMLAWSKGWIGVFDEYSTTFLPKVDLRIDAKSKVASTWRFLERCLRETPRTAALFDNRVFIAQNGRLIEAFLDDGAWIESLRFREGMRSPLKLSVVEGVEGFDDCLVFGDYWGNPNRESVSIHALAKGANTWETAATLPAGALCHIHAVIPNSERRSVLVLTGDADDECAVLEYRNNFAECRVLLSGSQAYRSCVALPWKDGYIYATDSPIYKNGLYYYRDGGLKRLQDLRGSCIYSDSIPDGGIVFSSAVEPDSRLPVWQYRLSLKPGPGILDNWIDVYVFDDRGFRAIRSFEKDFLPAWMFQFGTIEPVVGYRSVYLNCNALRGHDRDVLAIEKDCLNNY